MRINVKIFLNLPMDENRLVIEFLFVKESLIPTTKRNNSRKTKQIMLNFKEKSKRYIDQKL